MSNPRKKTSVINSLSKTLGFGQSNVYAEKARLEAFLSAVPGEYCGWASDQSVVYSQGFCEALGLSVIESITDLQNRLMPDDAAMLEGLFSRLSKSGIAFTMNVETRTGERTLKLSGTRGVDLSGADQFHILWLEDITNLKAASEEMEGEQREMRNEMDELQHSLDAMPHAVWVRNAAHKITWCNVAYSKLIGATPSEVIAQQKEIISPTRKRKPKEKDMLFAADLARAAIEKGTKQSVKVHEVLGGKRLLLNISEVPIREKSITVGMAEDVTGEEAIQGQIENNQSANRALLEQLRSAIGIYNAEQRLEFYNSSFAQLWGLEEGWLNTSPKLGEVMEKLRETRRLPEQADFRTYKKTWLDMFTDLIDPLDDMLYLPDGSALRMLVVPHKLGGLMMTFEDVTSRLELESSYNTLIAVQKETLDNLEEGVAVYGGDGRLKLWNPSFARLWSFDPEALEGEPHITRITEKVSSFFNETNWKTNKEYMISLGLERAVNEGRFERLDGSIVDYSTMPLPDGGVLITYADVTDTVRVENALREKNIALEAAEQLKLDFLANVSYQLRTPLNAIMGFNEMLTQQFFGPLNEKQKEYTGDIHNASERLLNLINDILDLSTIEAGQMSLSIEPTSVKDMMGSIFDLVEDWARKQQIEVKLSCPANTGKADLDETRMKQALINLVRNSIAYSQKGGEIELKAKRTDDLIMFEVNDNGSGIAKEDQERVMQPFERVEDSTADRGAGLGLTLVQNITALHGGTFDLKSVEGEGTRVTLSIPAKASDT